MVDDEQMYTLKEVRTRLKVSERTIHRWLDNGKLSGNFVGGLWRFSEQQVQALIRARNRNDSKGVGTKRKYTKKAKESNQ